MKIEFNQEAHKYLVNDMPVMSVTNIISELYPRKYNDVPKQVLENAAAYGTRIHALIERYNEVGDNELELCVEGVAYPKIAHEIGIEVISTEEMVAYLDDDKPLYAGRYDMLATIALSGLTMIDIKTTSKLDKESLSWQLSMYAAAYEQMNNTRIDALGCLWFPKRAKGKFVEIPRLYTKLMIETIKDIENVEI